jgi:hypothetical protein
MEKATQCRPPGIFWSPLHFQIYFSREILHRKCNRPRARTSSNWYTSSEYHCRASARKCTDGDVVTLITTVQQIMTGLQTAKTERTGLLSLEEQIVELLFENKGHSHPYPSCNTKPLSCLILLTLREEVTLQYTARFSPLQA